jgi:hypothetical protein
MMWLVFLLQAGTFWLVGKLWRKSEGGVLKTFVKGVNLLGSPNVTSQLTHPQQLTETLVNSILVIPHTTPKRSIISMQQLGLDPLF